MNYIVTVYTRLGGMNGCTIGNRRVEKTKSCRTVAEMTEFINREACVNGWRDFDVVTVGDTLAGIPLK